MRRALEEYRIMGVKTNIPFHQHMMDSHRFLTGQFDTKFVEERFSMEDREATDHLEAAIAATWLPIARASRPARSSPPASGTPAIGNTSAAGSGCSVNAGSVWYEVFCTRGRP